VDAVLVGSVMHRIKTWPGSTQARVASPGLLAAKGDVATFGLEVRAFCRPTAAGANRGHRLGPGPMNQSWAAAAGCCTRGLFARRIRAHPGCKTRALCWFRSRDSKGVSRTTRSRARHPRREKRFPIAEKICAANPIDLWPRKPGAGKRSQKINGGWFQKRSNEARHCVILLLRPLDSRPQAARFRPRLSSIFTPPPGRPR